MKSGRGTLSKRERQIMDALYRLGAGTAAEIQSQLADPPGNATVRKLLSILEEKGAVRHVKRGNQYEYHPTVPIDEARESMLSHMVETFFEGSAASAVLTLMKKGDIDIGDRERDLIAQLIERSREAGQ